MVDPNYYAWASPEYVLGRAYHWHKSLGFIPWLFKSPHVKMGLREGWIEPGNGISHSKSVYVLTDLGKSAIVTHRMLGK